jgi:hypothetical protein
LFLRSRGFKVGQCNVSHKPRLSGKSRYRMLRGRLLRGIAACIWARYIVGRIKKKGNNPGSTVHGSAVRST